MFLKTPERHHLRCFNVFILNLRQFSHLVLVFQLLILNRKLLAGKSYKVQPLKARSFFHLILQLLKFVFRPLNSHGFTVCHKVSLPSSRSHGRFFISHGFTNFKSIFSRTHIFLRKKTRQHNPLSKKYCSIVFYIQKNK